MSNRVGRPTKYNEELQAQANDYLATWSDNDAIPSRVGLCCYLGIAKQTSYEWEEIHPEFSDTLAAIDALQEHTAINKGITGTFNSTITKLVLANHGYHEKQQTDHTSSDGSMTPKPALDMTKLSDSALKELIKASDEPDSDE